MAKQRWARYIQQLAQQQHLTKDAKTNADRLLDNTFLFDSPYAMEPTQISYTMDPIKWQETPNGDPEWLYMLKRQEYLLDLLEAFYTTGQVKYQTKMKALLFSWIGQNLALPETWRTIDTGIRLLNWTSVVANLVESEQLNASESVSVHDAVKVQADYLRQNYTEKFDISNWGILITSGILTYAARFPDVVDRDTVTWAQQRFEVELDLQVDTQGMQWEQSPLYLLEVWRSSLAVIAAQQRAKQTVAPNILQKTRAMQRMMAQYVKPDLTLLQQGDTDAIRIDSLFNSSAAILSQPAQLQDRLEPVFDFVLLELAHQAWQLAAKKAELPQQFAAPISGNYFWRSDWGENADYWHLFNGNLGSGHGHAALGHLDLVMDGHDVLVDGGRYTYVDGTERRYLKSVEAHNTVMLDHKPFSLPKDSWKYQYAATPVTNQVIDFSAGQLIKAVYIDRAQQTPVMVVRYLINLAEERLRVILDVVSDPGYHTLKRFWQIAPDLTVTKQAEGYQLGNVASLAVTERNIWKSRQLFSPRYNALDHLTRLESETLFKDFTAQAAVFSPANPDIAVTPVQVRHSGNDDEIVDDQLATGFRVDLGRDVNYLVTLQSENTIVGRKLYWFDGTEAYGSFNLFKRKGQRVGKHFQLL